MDVRERLQDYLIGLLEADVELRLGRGWGAVEGWHRGRSIVRVFPKNGLVKVDSVVPGSEPGHYGPDVELTKNGEWSVFVRNEEDVGVLWGITSDAIHHADGRRVMPPGLTPASRASLGATVARSKGRTRLSQSRRFAIFDRDRFTCQYCGRRAPEVVLHVDHRKPVSRGGTDDSDNLLTACVDCNLGKSDRFET